MEPRTLEERVTILEEQMRELGDLPIRMRAVELQIVELRNEVRAEFSATRHDLRAEMYGVRDELRTEMHGIRDELRGEIQSLGVALRQEIRTAEALRLRIATPPSQTE